MKKNVLSVTLAAVLGVTSLSALAETWALDASHSTVGFSVRHLMGSNVKGAFGKFTASADGNPADPTTATIVGARATGKINRKDFGVSWSKNLDGGGLVVGDDVTIQLDLELVKKDEPAK
jgi:polyisoprenoid-binding protein YceI